MTWNVFVNGVFDIEADTYEEAEKKAVEKILSCDIYDFFIDDIGSDEDE